MRFKKYYKDTFSLFISLAFIYWVHGINEIKVNKEDLAVILTSQESQIEDLKNKVNLLGKNNERLLSELKEHDKIRGKENAALLTRIKNLEEKVNILNLKPMLSNITGNKRFEFEDIQVNRVGTYETKGQVLVAWKDDYLTTQKVDVTTTGEIVVTPKIEKLSKNSFVSYIDETYIGGITIRGQGEPQRIEPPRNQFSLGPFLGVAYNATTGLTEPIIGIGVSYNLVKLWDWR
jgi:hypothetical protein